MKTLTLLLVVCAGTSAQFAQAQDQPSLAAIRAACAEDAQKLCPGVQPGGGRIVACLKEHKDSLSDRCKQAAGLAANASGSSAPGAPAATSGSSAATADSPATSSSSVARPSVSAATETKPAPASKAASSKSAPAKSNVAKGDSATKREKFVERVIADSEHNGMRAATIHLPEKWNFESKIEWHYGWIEYPITFSSHSENPDNAEAYFQYPLLRLETVDVAPQLRQYDPGRKVKPGDRLPTGAISMAPQPPMKAMVSGVKHSFRSTTIRIPDFV
jgi:hypothetical protein